MPLLSSSLGAIVAGVLAVQGEETTGERAKRPRNLLVVTIDTTRRDHMGFLGREPSPTPRLDELARESVVFEDAYTVAPLTLPAHTSLFTGLSPRSHGVKENSAFKVPQSARTLAEALRERGYATGAAVGAFVLDRMFGLDQGFDRYDVPELGRSNAALITERQAGAVIDRALADLAELAEPAADGSAPRPFFYWVHLFDPHFPYVAHGFARPAGVLVDDEAQLRALYEGEIAYADREIGRLLDELRRRGRYDDLVVLVASDHGESLRDALEPTHGYFLFDPTVRIPMLLRSPGIAPQRVAAQVSLIDAMPTLLGLLGIDAPELRFDGLDLAPLLRGETTELPDRAILLESWYPWIGHGWAPLLGCVHGPLKHVRSRRLELFDRAADASERANLFDPQQPPSRAMARRLDELLADGSNQLERDPLALEGRDLARLLAVGYMAAPQALDDLPELASLPDPYEKIEVIRALESALEAKLAGDKQRELAITRSLVEQEPQSAQLREALGMLLLQLGPDHHDEAERVLRAAIRIDPKTPRSHFALGRLADKRAERLRERIKTLRAADGEPDKDEIRELVQEERHQVRRALREYRTCLEFEANFPDAIEQLARLLTDESDRALRGGEKDEARAFLEEAAALLARWSAFTPAGDEKHVQIDHNRGVVARRLAALEQAK